jgi:hypothetical protein
VRQKTENHRNTATPNKRFTWELVIDNWELSNYTQSPFNLVLYPGTSGVNPPRLTKLTNQVEGDVGLTSDIGIAIDFIQQGVNNPS